MLRFLESYRRRLLTSLCCSSAVHGALVGFVAVELLYGFLPLQPAAGTAGIELQAEPLVHQSSEPALHVGEEGPVAWIAGDAADLSHLIDAVDDPRWREALLEAHDPPADAPRSADFVTGELLRSIAAAESQSDDANLDRLEELSDRLAGVSTKESVDQIAASLKGWLGTGERATRPADEPVAGEFDFSTAQLHDVRRDDSGGAIRYTAILLDAAGRTTESELTPAEGESVYRVMQLMKDNPLLERVYRGVVLSLLDKLMGESGGRKAESRD